MWWEEVAFFVWPHEPKHPAGAEDPDIAQQNRGSPMATELPCVAEVPKKLSWALGSHQ